MSTTQAIAGVSPREERTVAITYPSVSAGGAGRWFGRVFDSIPIGVGKVNLSRLLFVLPAAPFTLLLYLLGKAFGDTYEVTNRSVNVWSMLLGKRNRRTGSVDLATIAEVAVEQQDGQQFFNAADLFLLNEAGDVVLKLPAVANPAVFRQTILKARDARVRTDAALANIEARKTA